MRSWRLNSTAAFNPLVEAVRQVGVPIVKDSKSALHDALVLLRVAAEIEHSLLVQYLYAAYSLELDPARFRGVDPPDPAIAVPLVQGWYREAVGISIEEMGHLVTVQNLLVILRGGGSHLYRQRFPASTSLYPFPYRLEPLSDLSLAKYTCAEMPLLPDSHLTFEQRAIAALADRSPAGTINHVGVVYARLLVLFQASRGGVCHPWIEPLLDLFPKAHLADDDFDFAAGADYQSLPSEWHFPASNVLVLPVASRQDGIDALTAIALQGEGPVDASASGGPPPQRSHYDRFLSVFRQFTTTAGPRKWIPARDIPVNPSVHQGRRGTTYIAHPGSRRVALLLNIRYAMLLALMWHGLNRPRSEPLREQLLDWAIRTMTRKRAGSSSSE